MAKNDDIKLRYLCVEPQIDCDQPLYGLNLIREKERKISRSFPDPVQKIATAKDWI